MERFVLASANPHKAQEIAAILVDIDLLPRPTDVADVDETDDTLEGNARLKAFALVNATGLPAIADDTGLEVDELGGAPGVYSARYAGADATYADNVCKLHEAMIGASTRTARFRTVALAGFPDGTEIIGHGVIEGVIADDPTGDGGFGYDPLFIPTDGDGRTFAEMTLDEKERISHRGRAFRALAAGLRNRG
ncbi:MAG: RdgB/HAM1 family non-canonical purine NTP pyrophosphatase [Actinobacteria bacterium]|nr:RdgB/HAM1 family non-canonical purine NTP pyrophosphatase [Actinomycetota bacterium]